MKEAAIKRVKETALLDKCQITITFQCIYDVIKASLKMKQEDFVRTVLPDELAEIIGNNQTACSRLCRCENSMAARFAKARDRLLDLEGRRGGPYTYENSPIRQDMLQRWEALLSSGQIGRETLSRSVKGILKDRVETGAKDGPQVQETIRELLKKGKIPEALTALTLIASTLFCWNHFADGGVKDECQDEAKNKALYDLALSPSARDLATFHINQAVREIKTAENFTMDSPAFDELQAAVDAAGECGDRIMEGKAYYWLAAAWRLCGEKNAAHSYLRKSAEAGYEPAKKALNDDDANQTAKAKLSKAAAYFSNLQFRECCQICKYILAMIPAPGDLKVTGQAAWLAYQCKKSSPGLLKAGERPGQYLAISRDCGYEEAVREWESRSDIVPPAERSQDESEGTYFLNSSNPVGWQLQKTAPSGWSMGEWKPDGLCADGAEDTVSGQRLKFFLIDDSQTRNFHDALTLLQKIQNSPDPYSRSLEIYLRGDHEYLHSLIDTAMSHMEKPVPVHIIDDNLWPIQWLLSRHPLFYPIRSLPENCETALHLVVVGNTKRTEWLVREAFALMDFEGRNVRCRITVAAPDADRVQNDLYLRCPGLSKEAAVEGVPMAELSFAPCGGSFLSRELMDRLAALYQEPNSNCYFVVDTGDRERNLDLSVKLRELFIRSVILTSKRLSKAEKYARLTRLPPIAFFCEDPYTAHLSRGMVFELENFGNQWFNSPCLIPFGALTDRYTWDNIAGGMFERFAQTIHLRYNYSSRKAELVKGRGSRSEVPQDSISIPASELDRLYETAMDDYFRQCYNHDSSLSVAVSLPYRLFQFQEDKRGQPETSWTYSVRKDTESAPLRLTPPCWRIVDPDAYCSEWQIAALGERLSSFSPGQWREQVGRVAKWEHDRWARWMLSRGWLPESADESAICHEFGNKRHQLYIAKLHPCICAYGETLSNLSEELEVRCGMKKDFVSLDKDSVDRTAHILSLKWHDEHSDREEEH